jgi:sulfonate transport system permease protein
MTTRSVRLGAARAGTSPGAVRLRRARRGLVLPVLLLLSWWIAARWHLANQHLLAPPGQILAEARRLVAEGELWTNLGASLARDLAGAALGAGAGLVAGMVLGLSRRLNRYCGPSLHAAKQVAVVAWIPLISVWFGYGEPAKVVTIALAAFYPVAVNGCEGVRGVAAEHFEVARVLRFTRWQLLRRVILPSTAASIFAGLRLALIYAWLATIGAEYLLATGPGIGRLMIDGRNQFRMDRVLLGVLITGTVGYALTSVLSLVESRVLRWRPSDRTPESE